MAAIRIADKPVRNDLPRPHRHCRHRRGRQHVADGMAAGAISVIAAPAIAAAIVGYLAYRFVLWLIAQTPDPAAAATTSAPIAPRKPTSLDHCWRPRLPSYAVDYP